MENWQPKQAGFFERLALLFIKELKHVYFDDELGTEVMLVYKKFRGVTYIIRFVTLPPKHVNCRCVIAPNGLRPPIVQLQGVGRILGAKRSRP